VSVKKQKYWAIKQFSSGLSTISGDNIFLASRSDSDIMLAMNEALGTWAPWLAHFEGVILRLAVAALIFGVGWAVSVIAGRAVRKLALRSNRVDPTIVPMAHTVTVWAIRIIVLIATLAQLGVQTAS